MRGTQRGASPPCRELGLYGFLAFRVRVPFKGSFKGFFSGFQGSYMGFGALGFGFRASHPHKLNFRPQALTAQPELGS